MKAIVERKTWNFSHQNGALPMIFFGSLKKLVLAEFFKTELLENVPEPSRVELFDQKLEPNPSQTEPSLGSGATLENSVYTVSENEYILYP